MCTCLFNDATYVSMQLSIHEQTIHGVGHLLVIKGSACVCVSVYVCVCRVCIYVCVCMCMCVCGMCGVCVHMCGECIMVCVVSGSM